MPVNQSNIQKLYRFAANSSCPGGENQGSQGVIFHGLHELLLLENLQPRYDSKHFLTRSGKGKSRQVMGFISNSIEKYGLVFENFSLIRTPIPSESQFEQMCLPFDHISEEWTRCLAGVATSLIAEIGKRFNKEGIDIDIDMYLVNETTSSGLEDTLTEVIKTTAEMFAWIGLGHDYNYNMELIESAVSAIENPNANNPVSVYSSLANTGFGLLVPLIESGFLTKDIIIYQDDGMVVVNPYFKEILKDWKVKAAKSDRYTGGCLWRFREYTKEDGTKYELEYSMIDMAALVFLKFLRQIPENTTEV